MKRFKLKSTLDNDRGWSNYHRGSAHDGSVKSSSPLHRQGYLRRKLWIPNWIPIPAGATLTQDCQRAAPAVPSKVSRKTSQRCSLFACGHRYIITDSWTQSKNRLLLLWSSVAILLRCGLALMSDIIVCPVGLAPPVVGLVLIHPLGTATCQRRMLACDIIVSSLAHLSCGHM